MPAACALRFNGAAAADSAASTSRRQRAGARWMSSAATLCWRIILFTGGSCFCSACAPNLLEIREQVHDCPSSMYSLLRISTKMFCCCGRKVNLLLGPPPPPPPPPPQQQQQQHNLLRKKNRGKRNCCNQTSPSHSEPHSNPSTAHPPPASLALVVRWHGCVDELRGSGGGACCTLHPCTAPRACIV